MRDTFWKCESCILAMIINQSIEYWYTMAWVDIFINLYFFPTEKYLNNNITMPYPAEDNIANP